VKLTRRAGGGEMAVGGARDDVGVVYEAVGSPVVWGGRVYRCVGGGGGWRVN